jgi:hypothetical protein
LGEEWAEELVLGLEVVWALGLGLELVEEWVLQELGGELALVLAVE